MCPEIINDFGIFIKCLSVLSSYLSLVVEVMITLSVAYYTCIKRIKKFQRQEIEEISQDIFYR